MTDLRHFLKGHGAWLVFGWCLVGVCKRYYVYVAHRYDIKRKCTQLHMRLSAKLSRVKFFTQIF